MTARLSSDQSTQKPSQVSPRLAYRHKGPYVCTQPIHIPMIFALRPMNTGEQAKQVKVVLLFAVVFLVVAALIVGYTIGKDMAVRDNKSNATTKTLTTD